MEQVGSLIPMDPHPPQIVAQQVEKRISGQEAKGIGNPVSFIRSIIIIRLIPFPQFPDGLGPLIICPGPNPQRNAIQGVRRILLQHKRVMDAVRLRPTCTYLYVMRKASLIPKSAT
jgi:hypothetical protein